VLRSFDFFGSKIPLNINKQDSYTTSIGGIASLCIVALMTAFFQSNVWEVYYKSNINTDVSTLYSTEPDLMIFNQTNAVFAVSIRQSNSFSENPLMNITMEQR
jgi:hypothetical protein